MRAVVNKDLIKSWIVATFATRSDVLGTQIDNFTHVECKFWGLMSCQKSEKTREETFPRILPLRRKPRINCAFHCLSFVYFYAGAAALLIRFTFYGKKMFLSLQKKNSTCINKFFCRNKIISVAKKFFCTIW